MQSIKAEMQSIKNKMRVLSALYIPVKIFQVVWSLSPPVLLYLYLTK